MTPARTLAFGFAALFAGAAFAYTPNAAVAQGSVNDYGIRDIMVDEPGRPSGRKRAAPMKAEPQQTEPNRTEPKQKAQSKQRGERKARVRGSGYVPNLTLPRSEAVRVPQTPDIYRPPPINSFGDRVTGCNHSFPLNAGIGNNPTDRSSYVRQCAN